MLTSRNTTEKTNVAVVLTDFDGTLTLTPGSKLVFSSFYNELMKNPGTSYPAELKDVENLIPIMQQVFKSSEEITGKRDARRLTQEAIKFLHTILQRDDIKVAVMTRNLTKYIEAMLKYEGLSDNEIKKISIIDDKRKDTAADEYLSKLKSEHKICTVIATDDDETDCTYLNNGAQIHCDHVISDNQKPGKFEWDRYLKNLNASLGIMEEPPLNHSHQAQHIPVSLIPQSIFQPSTISNQVNDCPIPTKKM